MASIGQYLQRLRVMHRLTAAKLGMDLQRTSKENRVLAASAGAVIATIVKALTDKGVITDADLETAWLETVGTVFPREPEIGPQDHRPEWWTPGREEPEPQPVAPGEPSDLELVWNVWELPRPGEPADLELLWGVGGG